MNGMYKTWEQWEGQVVNEVFRLGEYLGGGERSAVFVTEDALRNNQKAAIKLVQADAGDAELQLSRWQVASELSHPHLMGLFSMGRCQLDETELLYVLMEYAEENLAQVLLQRPLTPAEAREMLEPALNALAYLHRKGFVHGHVKPANIMAANNELKISSDGLCRIGDPGWIRGRLTAYDPPELATGEISPAADVWSLGITLVEVLTQRAPVWARTGSGEPQVPSSIPAPFGDIARHCLLRAPQRRCTVADIASELQQVPASNDVAVPQSSFARRRYVAPAAALALVLAAILVGPRLFKRSPGAQTSAPIEHPNLPPKPESAPIKPQGDYPSETRVEKAAPLAAAPKPVQPEARARDLTGPRAPGEVLHQALPSVPRSARDTIHGKVRVSVKIRVAPSGSVTAATLDRPGPSHYFAKLALQAARSWKFVPARVGGNDVASTWTLRFEFARNGTRVFPAQTAPYSR